MATAATTLWSLNASATASNVNGGGFNPGNANMVADLTTDANTANTASPIVSSATYAFVAGDVGHWLYIKSGTNWTPGFYPIVSVAAGKATLNAAIGAAVQLFAVYNQYLPSTVVGCATVGTPTAGTFTIDYSQSTAAIIASVTDFSSVGSSTTMTSATAGFTPVMVGNYYRQTTTGTGAFGVIGWYEIVNYTNATTVVLDRTPNNGTASVNCTGSVGGSISLNHTNDGTFFAIGLNGNRYFWKNGTFILGQTTSIAINGTGLLPIEHIGFNTIRGDSCTPFGPSPTAPMLNVGANSFTFGSYHNTKNMRFTGTEVFSVVSGNNSICWNVKATNTSTSANRVAWAGGQNSVTDNFEAVSQNGYAAFPNSNNVNFMNYYVHDSRIGRNVGSNSMEDRNGLFLGNFANALNITSNDSHSWTNLTIYGFATPISAITNNGVAMVAGVNRQYFQSCIFSGYQTGIIEATNQDFSNRGRYNVFFNNTTNATRYSIDPSDSVGVNPGFTDLSELTGTGATSAASTITLAGSPNLSAVEDNVDYIFVESATTAVVMSYLITGHNDGADTVTVSPAIGNGTNIVWHIRTGHNASVGTAMKNLGFPGTFGGSTTTSYTEPGASQQQQSGGGGSYTFA